MARPQVLGAVLTAMLMLAPAAFAAEAIRVEARPGGVVGPGLGPNAVQFDEAQVRVATTEAHGAGLRVSASVFSKSQPPKKRTTTRVPVVA